MPGVGVSLRHRLTGCSHLGQTPEAVIKRAQLLSQLNQSLDLPDDALEGSLNSCFPPSSLLNPSCSRIKSQRHVCRFLMGLQNDYLVFRRTILTLCKWYHCPRSQSFTSVI